MKQILKKANHLIFLLTCLIGCILYPLGLLDELLGAGFLMRVLTPNGYDYLVKFGLVFFAIFLVTLILKIKMFRE